MPTLISRAISDSIDILSKQKCNKNKWPLYWRLFCGHSMAHGTVIFNMDKCKVMHVGRRNLNSTYYMNDIALGSIDEEKDLGIFITDDLKWSTHCQQTYTRANRVLGMINRTISSRDKQILLSLYKTLVRPHLEYCSPAWSPHYKKDKQLLERVQHRFTRMLSGLKSLEYDDQLKTLGIWSLEERRNRADLLEVFKMKSGFSAVTFDTFFTVDSQQRTRGHSWKIIKHRSNLDVRNTFSQSGFQEQIRRNPEDKSRLLHTVSLKVPPATPTPPTMRRSMVPVESVD